MLREIPYQTLEFNPMTMLDRDWLALTAGNETDGYNSMTVSWGHLGTLWGRPTAVCYVRPQRYTRRFMDKEETFTLSWFGSEQRQALGILGSQSGRDGDKIAQAGLTPVFTDGTTAFAEAKLVFVCRTLYQAPILEEGFRDRSLIDEEYPQRDYHDLYVGEIIRVLRQED